MQLNPTLTGRAKSVPRAELLMAPMFHRLERPTDVLHERGVGRSAVGLYPKIL
jgi:hypothetical protein